MTDNSLNSPLSSDENSFYRRVDWSLAYFIRVNHDIIGWCTTEQDAKEIVQQTVEKLYHNLSQDINYNSCRLIHHNFDHHYSIELVKSWWYWPFAEKKQFLVTFEGPFEKYEKK